MTTDSWGVTAQNTFQFTAQGRTFGVQVSTGAMIGDMYVRLLELVGTGWVDRGAAYDAASVAWDAGITAAGGLNQFAAQLVTKLNALLAPLFAAAPAPSTSGPTDWTSFATWLISHMTASATATGVTLTFTP